MTARTLGGLVVVAALVGGCSATQHETNPGQDPEVGWVAAELSEAPDGLIVCEVREDSSQGRVVSYVHASEGVGDNCDVTVTASTSLYGWDLDDLIAFAAENSDRPVTLTEVDGRRAMVGPVTDDGREYGKQVVWEQAPGLVISVEDTRYENSRPAATEESVLALAAKVVGMDRARWDQALIDFTASFEYADPRPGSTGRILATGQHDGRPWTLSALVPPAGDGSAGVLALTCLRLEYAGEATGPGCASTWVVLGGTGFLLGWGPPNAAPTVSVGPTTTSLQQGDGPVLTDLAPPQVFPVDERGGVVWVTAVPAGTCTVVISGFPTASFGDRQLWLLPGDQGAAACAAA